MNSFRLSTFFLQTYEWFPAVSPDLSKTKTHPPGYISRAEGLSKLKSFSNNLNKLNPSRGAKDNRRKRLSIPPLCICQSAAYGEGGKQLCCCDPVGRDGGPDGRGITSAMAKGELGTAMPAAPPPLAHVQAREVCTAAAALVCSRGSTQPSCAEVWGMHSYLEEEIVLWAAEDAKSTFTQKINAFETGRWNWKWLSTNLK